MGHYVPPVQRTSHYPARAPKLAISERRRTKPSCARRESDLPGTTLSRPLPKSRGVSSFGPGRLTTIHTYACVPPPRTWYRDNIVPPGREISKFTCDVAPNCHALVVNPALPGTAPSRPRGQIAALDLDADRDQVRARAEQRRFALHPAQVAEKTLLAFRIGQLGDEIGEQPPDALDGEHVDV